MAQVLLEVAGRVDGEAAARRALRAQVGRLERELSALAAGAFPRDVVAAPPGRPTTARLLSLGELEVLRDRLAERVAAARDALAERTAREERARVLLEQMLLDPGRHRFVRVANADLGEGGCGVWHVRPRLGLIGMLMGWWQVKLSSGCPLASGSSRDHRPERWVGGAARQGRRPEGIPLGFRVVEDAAWR